MKEESIINNRRPEILAPCGSVLSLKGAVSAGADAVYIGGRKFGARAFADNPEMQELLDAIDFVHLNGKKIYVTVNTLLKEDELEKELCGEVLPLYERGVDAVIVQDLGVMDLISKEFPGLPIHGSTQLTVTNHYGANLLKERFGITRVVPSRELSLNEVKDLRANTDLELECFVHGALCYSFSGQCLMSSMIGGRSGNRGRCAQPCRTKYDLLIDNKKVSEGYLLSLKDMCTLEAVPDLIDAGIDSFKIEGRMKKPEYTALMTSCYRFLTDLYLKEGRKGYEKIIKEDPGILERLMESAKEIYNRGGFSKGYYFKYHGPDMMCPERPNHSGVKVGTVTGNINGRLTIKTESPLNPGDVLEVRSAEPFEFTVGKETAERLKNDKKNIFEVNSRKSLNIQKGSPVYRTKNESLLKDISDKYLQKDAKGKVSGECILHTGEPALLKVSFEGTENTAYGDIVDKAESSPVTAEGIKNTLNKTGESIFAFDDLNVVCSDDAFVPVGAVKALRRKAFDGLKEKVLLSFKREAPAGNTGVHNVCPVASQSDEARERAEIICRVSNEEQFEEALKSAIPDTYYIDLVEGAYSDAVKIYEKAERAGRKAFIVLPHIFRLKERDSVEKELDLSKYKAVANSVDEIGYLLSRGITDFRLSETVYVMNSRTFNVLRDICGENALTSASLELNCGDLKNLPCGNMSFKIYGRTELMYTAQCLRDNYINCLKKHAEEKAGILAIRDRTNAVFPVKTSCRSCLNIIYNAKIYSVIGQKELEDLKFKAHIIAFTFETKEEVREVLKSYLNIGKRDDDYTRGHFRRGVE